MIAYAPHKLFFSLCLLSMSSKILPLTFVLLSLSLVQSYIIQSEDGETDCTVLPGDPPTVRCLLENSEPRHFIAEKPLSSIRMEFLIGSVTHLTLPNDFFISTSPTSNFAVYPKSLMNDLSIHIDTTTNPSFKQLTILNDTFANIFFHELYFIVNECAQPILHIDSDAFRFFTPTEVKIIWNNRSDTAHLFEYLTFQCHSGQNLRFSITTSHQAAILIKSDRPFQKHAPSYSRMITNGILLVLLFILTLLLLLIHLRQETKRQVQQQILSSKRTSSVDRTHIGTISISESSTSVVSPLP